MNRPRCALLLLLAVVTCSPRPIPLDVEYAGCKAVLALDLVCVLDPSRELRLWVGAPPDARIEIQAAGERIEAAGEPVQAGRRFSMTLPLGARQVKVLASSPEGKASWSLALAERGGGGDLLREIKTRLGSVHQDIADGRLADARKTLETVRLPGGAPAEARFNLSYYRGLLAEKEGDYRSAMAAVQEAERIAERVKLDRWRWMARQKQAMLLTGVGRFGDAVQLFERLRRQPHALTPCGVAEVPANQAWAILLAREAGERLGDPMPLLESALATFETCEQFTPEDRMNLLIDLAFAHLQEGRPARAKALLAEARGLDPDPPLPHILWNLDLEARIALQEGRPREALGRFEEIEKLAIAASSPEDRLRAAFGRARSHEALGERATALEDLRQAEALLDELSRQVPLQEGRETFMATRHAVVNLHVELLLEQGRDAEALRRVRHARSRLLRQMERSHSLAALPSDRRARWERLLAEYHGKRAALEQRAKDEWRLPANRVPREQAAREAEAEDVKELLDQAFQVLPRERSQQEPAPPRPGELILAYHPLSHGWAGFAAQGDTVHVHRFELPADLSPRRLSPALLLPFRDSIAGATRIRILASGPLQGVDFHALPFEGDILLAKAPVVYGLDLPASSAPAGVRERHALVVADPRDDLRAALDESRRVLAALRSGPRPWIAEELKSAEASAEAVGERLGSADLLHYAGHGNFSGFGGWDSSLLLAGETRLTVGDLLALDRRVPAWVVLSACETGRSSTAAPVQSIGLAHAFLLAGSRAVIASIRPAKDSDVSAFFPVLYKEWEGAPDLAVALQRAQLSWRRRNPGADWQGFRLFEP